MGTQYFVELECSADDTTQMGSIIAIIKTIAPFIVDNVEVKYGIITPRGERVTG